MLLGITFVGSILDMINQYANRIVTFILPKKAVNWNDKSKTASHDSQIPEDIGGKVGNENRLQISK